MRERARKALRGEQTDCIPLFDMPLHPSFLEKLTGLDPYTHTEQAVVKALHKLDIDLLNCAIPEDTGNDEDSAEQQYDIRMQGFWRNKESTMHDIFDYNPLKTHWRASLPVEELAENIKKIVDRDERLAGDVGQPIGFTFTTCIHFAAENLDWEEFLIACLTEEEKVSEMLDVFEQASAKIMQAHRMAGVEVMFSHDDIAMRSGTVQSPAWLRKHIFPRYKRLWRPLREAGIPILQASDGNIHAVAEDIAEAGADGFFLDTPCTDLAKLADQVGHDKIFFTGPSPATMTTGTPAAVRDSIKAMAEVARDLPGFFFHMPGGWPHNMPVENVQMFYEACREFGQR